MDIKSTIYHTSIQFLKFYWQIIGHRSLTLFGHRYRFSPSTIFPTYRNLKLPKGGYESQIVRYTDFVQFHAIVKYVTKRTDNPIIIDVGAHHGAYAITLGKIVHRLGGKVIAIEPNPESYNVLLENVKLNNLDSTIICKQVALLDESGFTSISLNGSESRVSLKRNSGPVEVTTLEKIMNKYGIENVDLLIIDVEGAELPVLKGFPWKSIKPGRIFCELHPYAWKDFGYTGEDFRLFLEKHRYRCFDMYLHEHTLFDKNDYIGPCVFVPI